MRKFLFLILFLSFPILCLAQDAATPATSKQENRQALQLTIKSDKEVYELDEPINVHYEIKNIGDKDLTIIKPDIFVYPSFAKMSPLSFEIKTEKGEELNFFYGIGYGSCSASGCGKEDIIILKKDEEASGDISFRMFSHWVKSHPGPERYNPVGEKLFISAFYRGGDAYEVNAGNGSRRVEIVAWKDTWKCNLNSNPIIIKVVSEQLPSCAEKVKSIKVGMIRGDVEKFFERDGLDYYDYDPYERERYVFKDCLCQSKKNIKIDVSFRPFKESGGYGSNPNDVITSISVPYCEHRFVVDYETTS